MPTSRTAARSSSGPSPAAARSRSRIDVRGSVAPDSSAIRATDFSEVIGMMPGMIGLAPCSGSSATTRSRSRR